MKKFFAATLLAIFMMFPSYVMAQGGGAQTSSWEVMGYIHTQTTLVATTDASALLTVAFDAAYAGDPLDWTKVKAVLISTETNNLRMSWGVAAENDGTPVGHLCTAGKDIWIEGYNAISRTYVISATAGSPASMQITLLY